MLRYGECMTCALPRWGGGALGVQPASPTASAGTAPPESPRGNVLRHAVWNLKAHLSPVAETPASTSTGLRNPQPFFQYPPLALLRKRPRSGAPSGRTYRIHTHS